MKKLVRNNFFDFNFPTSSSSFALLNLKTLPNSARNCLKFVKSKKFFKDRKGIVTEYLPWLLIALVVLAIVLISIFVLKGKGVSFIDQIKNLFRRG